MKLNLPFLLLLGLPLASQPLSARSLHLSPNGNDSGNGSSEHPLLTIMAAQDRMSAGDTLWIHEGTYKMKTEQAANHEDVMTGRGRMNYLKVIELNKSGAPGKRICYMAAPGENRPVFDFSEVRPDNKRVSAFWIGGDWIHMRGFDIVGVQVTMKGHTQSECISARGGSCCIFENIAMHDGMAIGYYQTAGHDNLVLNCDAYCNYDPYSEGPYGGNVDGFGGHVLDEGSTGNIFRGCRAWWNSDDGYDLIRCQSAFLIEDCWSFCNGFQPNTFERAGDGTGFKAGGFGMKPNEKFSLHVLPRHTVRNCIAYRNKNKGFYANHHITGINWFNNRSMAHPSNYCMLNRIGTDVCRDTLGFDHVITGNISYKPTDKLGENHIIQADTSRCVISRNSWQIRNPQADDFESTDWKELMAPRKADGSLPDTKFMQIKKDSPLYGIDQK